MTRARHLAGELRGQVLLAQQLAAAETITPQKRRADRIVELLKEAEAMALKISTDAPLNAGDLCPFCNDQSRFSGDPAELFCEEHLAEYRSTGNA